VKVRLHKVIFWTHLLAGVVAGLVIFIMSFTGVILTYEPQIAEYSEWSQRWVTPPGPGADRLALDDLVAKVRAANPEGHPAAITVKSDPAASVIVNLGRENTVFIDPYTGELLGGLSLTHHFMHEIVDWHRWLGMEDEGRAVGKAITGACNLAFFWLAVTGVYLWWPQSWKWRGLKTSLLFNVRLTGKARDWNWHNVIGFWSSSVLVVLTLTAAVMSYPWANDLLYTLTGSEPPPRAQGPAGPAQRAGRTSAGEKAPAKPVASFEALLATAKNQVPGWTMLMMRFPPNSDSPVAVSVTQTNAPHPFARSQLTLNRASADVLKWEPYAENSSGRKLRTWFRGLHTGEALGFFGQTIAGLASLGGCFLVWTGWSMAWRRFRSWRRPSAEIVEAVTSYTPDAPPGYETTNTAPAQLTTEPQDNKLQTPPANGHNVNPSGGEMISDYESITILYGTMMGNAESVAHRVAATLRRAGLSVRVSDMAHCQASLLTRLKSVLIVTSTYGNGEPPDDIIPFWQAVVHGNVLDLSGLKFSVLALGNTTYDHFCQCGREFDLALEHHGATRFYPRVDCDVDYEAPVKRWIDGVLTALQRRQAASAWTSTEKKWPELESAS
jgi:uncharacterized iron-regulated membrane protein/flavodoxin